MLHQVGPAARREGPKAGRWGGGFSGGLLDPILKGGAGVRRGDGTGCGDTSGARVDAGER